MTTRTAIDPNPKGSMPVGDLATQIIRWMALIYIAQGIPQLVYLLATETHL